MKPYVKEFQLTNGTAFTSVVMDGDEFNSLCDSLSDIFDANSNNRVGNEQIAALKEAQHIPMIAKGTLTKFIFDKYDVKTDRVSIIVRGTGMKLFDDIMSKENPEAYRNN